MKRTEPHVPLAARMRPRALDDFVGHEAVLGAGGGLRKAIEQGTVGSLILWGPPGIGKTTLAEIIARQMDAAIERVSAVTAGVKDLRAVLERAKEWRKINKPTVLIVDEIHRFNKAQQDVLLPAVEEGVVTLIGATTENPYFEVIAALVSRAEVVKLEGLTQDHVRAIVKRALKDTEHGVTLDKTLSKKGESALLEIAGGDARRALNILERAVLVSTKRTISETDIEAASQQRVVQYDKAGDAHYDTISAFIKSMRGSDADAALFYLFRMLAAGEDPKFIIRRMYIFASEDIGNADPHALMVVDAVARALEWVGLPEAEYNLAHAAVYLSAAPKSNAIKRAMEAVKEDVRRHGNATPPGHITNAPIAGMKRHGKGVGYQYPHDFPGGLVKQQYRPAVVQSNIYYDPTSEGFEKEVKRRIDQAKKVLRS
ncbi:MAG: replication-associated recombination protein A [Candidatus Andersenbacteria bacterium]